MNAGNPRLLKVPLLPSLGAQGCLLAALRQFHTPGRASGPVPRLFLRNLLATFHDSKILPESFLWASGRRLGSKKCSKAKTEKNPIKEET